MNRDNNITAHAGAHFTRPNSMRFIETALACGADGLEADIRRRGGTLVLSHNRPGAKAVTVRALFERITGSGIAVNCDLKEAGLSRDVYQLALQAGVAPQRLLFTGAISPEEVPALPGAMPFLNLEGLPFEGLDAGLGKGPPDLRSVERAADLCREAGASGLNLCFLAAGREVMDICARRGLLVTVWTPDLARHLRAMLSLRPYSITTNRPRLALKLRRALDSQGG